MPSAQGLTKELVGKKRVQETAFGNHKIIASLKQGSDRATLWRPRQEGSTRTNTYCVSQTENRTFCVLQTRSETLSGGKASHTVS